MKQKLGMPKSTYRHNEQIGEYRMILTSAKKIRFWPSTHVIDEASFVKIASNSWQAEVIGRSTSYQTPWMEKIWQETTVLQRVFKWTVTTVHSTLAVNSLTAKSVPAGTKLVLFGRYVLNIYIGIVQYFLRKTKTWHAKIYLPTQRTNRRISYDIN